MERLAPPAAAFLVWTLVLAGCVPGGTSTGGPWTLSGSPAIRKSGVGGWPPPVPWQTIGKSAGGQPIEATSFGRANRRVLFIGGVHGDEYGTDIAERFAGYLARFPAERPAKTEVHIIRCLNPDGRARDRRGNDNDVDLNRNMPTAGWQEGATRGLKGPTGLSAGSGPASEPETRALLKYLGKGFVRLVSIHSKGTLVDYDPASARALALRTARIAGYEVAPLTYGEYVTGSLGAYFPEHYGGVVLTIEVPSRTMDERLTSALLAAAR